jgi:Kae1-associated kinase Bud32
MLVPTGKILKKGAEAVLYTGTWFSLPALFKVRVEKAYRHPALDERIRLERTVNEARVMASLLLGGLPVPRLYEVDVKDHCIVMEHVAGTRLKDVIPSIEGRLGAIFKEIGRHVSKMHEMGIIHGDLTTSNIIHEETPGNGRSKLTFIDFGLSMHSLSVEDKAVDIHLFKRVITSTHADHFEHIFPPFLQGYGKYLEESGSAEKFDEIMKRMEKIATRGRYVEKRKRK